MGRRRRWKQSSQHREINAIPSLNERMPLHTKRGCRQLTCVSFSPPPPYIHPEMEVASTLPRPAPVALLNRIDWNAVSTWLLGFGLVAYLGLKGGGYDPLVHDQVGIAVWWIVLAGVLVGAFPRRRLGTLAWCALGLLAAFVAWTALSLTWTESIDKTSADLARVATYLGVFALALFIRGSKGTRRMVAAVGTGIAFVAIVALLSRLHPAWFPEASQTARFLPSGRNGSPTPSTTWNLARVAATSSKAVIVETDLRNPTLAKQHGLSMGPGLAEVLTHQVELDEAIQQRRIAVGANGASGGERELDVIVAGALPPNPAELLESQTMREVLARLKERYELVVVDTAPTGVVSDAFPLLRQVDGVIVVARMGLTTRDAAERLRDQLGRAGAPLLGVVANAIKLKRRGRYGKYGYGYGYYGPAPGEQAGSRGGCRRGLGVGRELGRAGFAVGLGRKASRKRRLGGIRPASRARGVSPCEAVTESSLCARIRSQGRR